MVVFLGSVWSAKKGVKAGVGVATKVISAWSVAARAARIAKIAVPSVVFLWATLKLRAKLMKRKRQKETERRLKKLEKQIELVNQKQK